MNIHKKLFIIGGSILLAASLTSCNSSSGTVSSDSVVGGSGTVAVAPGAMPPSVGKDTATAPNMGMLAEENGNSTPAGPSTVNQANITAENRQIIQTGNMTLETKNVETVFDEVKNIINNSNGFVSDSSFQSYYEQSQQAFLTARVPSAQLEQVMDSISNEGYVLEENVSSQDVTLSMVDLDAQIEAKQTSVNRMKALMEQSGKLSDLITIERELSMRQAELDSLTAQRQAMANQVQMSTLQINIRPKIDPVEPLEDPAPGFVAGWNEGWDKFMVWGAQTITDFGVAAPFLLFIVVPPILVVFLIGWVIVAAVRRKRRKAAMQEREILANSVPLLPSSES